MHAEEFSTLRVHVRWLTVQNASLTTEAAVFGPTKSEEDIMKWKMNLHSSYGFLAALLLTYGAAAQTKTSKRLPL